MNDEQLLAVLRSAAQVIRDWHGTRIPAEVEPMVWRIYWGQSPEMKPIREVLGEDPTRPYIMTGPTGPTGPGESVRPADEEPA